MPDTPLIRLGTRRSPLAMAQAHEARARLCAAHGWDESAVELVPVVARGARLQDRPLAELGGTGRAVAPSPRAAAPGAPAGTPKSCPAPSTLAASCAIAGRPKSGARPHSATRAAQPASRSSAASAASSNRRGDRCKAPSLSATAPTSFHVKGQIYLYAAILVAVVASSCGALRALTRRGDGRSRPTPPRSQGAGTASGGRVTRG